MLGHAALIAPAFIKLTLDKYQDKLLDYALEYLIRSPMPEVAYDGDKVAIAAGMVYLAEEVWYRAKRCLGAKSARVLPLVS